MRDISEYLEKDVSEVYTVTQPSVYNAIGKKGIRRATVIKDYAYTITARQDRTPAQVIDLGGGKYRYLTERPRGGSSWLCLYPPEQIRSCFTITF